MKFAYHLVIASFFVVGACTEPNPAYQPTGPGLDSSGNTWDGQTSWPDGSGPLLDHGQPLDGSGLVCTPNAFAGCSSPYHMLTCNPAGTGTITVPCAPHLCNQKAKRCNQCDPNRPPTCVGSAVHSCSNDGLLKVSSCPDGCDEGKCQKPCVKKTFYKDGDGDGFGDHQQKVEACDKPNGYVENDHDCNDADGNAHPGQSSWFYYPMKGYGAGDPLAFDYDCDNVHTKKRPQKHTGCFYKNGNCEGSGWNNNSVPDCAKWGWWTDCKKSSSGRTPCYKSPSQKIQSCR
jgi:hypothetical protein